MKRLLLCLALGLVSALPARADLVSLADLSAYLNALSSAEGRFTQINADGSVATGDIYLHRPGRIRFDYEGGDLTVIAGGQQVAIFDGRANTPPEQYPLAQTPLNLILARNVDLAASGMVVGHRFDGVATRVAAQDPDRPEIGTIEMFFTDNPVALRQWIITDNGGGQTVLVIDSMEPVGRLPASLFNITLEIATRARD